MSALNSIEDLLDQASAQGLDFFLLQKPFHPDALLDAMRASTDCYQ